MTPTHSHTPTSNQSSAFLSKTAATIYLVVLGMLIAALAVVFDTFERSTYSPLEKRDLAAFPAFSWPSLFDGTFTKSVNRWFSDSEPYRDEFMALSMNIKDGLKLRIGDAEQVTFHAANEPTAEESTADATPLAGDDRVLKEYTNEANVDGTAKIANSGIIIVGSGKNVRALMAYGGTAKGGGDYARAANKYKETFGEGVNVYCMVIPTAVDFYLPTKARSASAPQRPTINHIYSLLSPEVKAVDAYSALARHADEDIYLRTDHHWAPLGAYYAAERFAQVAGVSFPDLSHYTRRVVKGYVGNMYGYSNDASIKRAPEDFVFYVPQGVTYKVTYTDYTINEKYQVTGVGKPHSGPFFYHYKDGNSGAYCTFMGSDARITKVVTSTKNGRRVLILKDSFGNALPGYLFFSFEEIHVIDSRYFTKNMRDYVVGNHITDILFANNVFKAYSPVTYRKYLRFLSQKDGAYIHTTKPTTHDTAKVKETHSSPSSSTENEAEPKK